MGNILAPGYSKQPDLTSALNMSVALILSNLPVGVVASFSNSLERGRDSVDPLLGSGVHLGLFKSRLKRELIWVCP